MSMVLLDALLCLYDRKGIFTFTSETEKLPPSLCGILSLTTNGTFPKRN